MKNLIASIFAVVVLSATFLFAEESAADSVAALSVDTAAVQSEASEFSVTQNGSGLNEAELRQELAARDSVMALRDESCSAEKDSLRRTIEIEKARGGSWEESYNVLKKDNERCAQALSVSLGVNEKKQEKEKEDRKAMMMSSSTSFLGGLALGALLFWLIFD